MKYFISDLIVGMNHFKEFADRIDSLHDPDFGIEFTAFTHDDKYWEELCKTVAQMTCPMTFHGPYVQTEATADLASAEHERLMKNYEKVMVLASEYGVRHVVFHYSQLQFKPEDIEEKQKNAYAVMRDLTKRAKELGVHLVIENLCKQVHNHHLFTNEEYFRIFENIPDAESLIDLGHAHVNGLDVEKFLKTYGARVKGFHVHNNDGRSDQHLDYHKGTADIKKMLGLAGKYTKDANIVLEYEPHEHLTHEDILKEISEIKSWTEGQNL